MKMQLESTSEIIAVNGVPGRVWTGTIGEKKVKVEVLVTYIKASRLADLSELDAELNKLHVAFGASGHSAKVFCHHGYGGDLCEECFPKSQREVEATEGTMLGTLQEKR